MRRRTVVASLAGALAAPRLLRAQPSRTLRFVPQADPPILGPIVTTGLVSRNHGFLIFDTLYGVDAQFGRGRRWSKAMWSPMTTCSGA